MSILNLKILTKDSTTVTEDRQRLIYRGHVLQDESLISDYNIESGHTIHMIARPENYRELQSQANTPLRSQSDTTTVESERQSSAINATLDSLLENVTNASNSVEIMRSQLSEHQRNELPRVDRQDVNSMEHIRQGLLSLHTIFSTMDNNTTRQRSFQVNGERYFMGQWIDCKDTVNQWLEATILDISEVARTVFVHYNG